MNMKRAISLLVLINIALLGYYYDVLIEFKSFSMKREVKKPRIAILFAGKVGNFQTSSGAIRSDPAIFSYSTPAFYKYVIAPNQNHYEFDFFGHTNSPELESIIKKQYNFISFDTKPATSNHPLSFSIEVATRLAMNHSKTHGITYHWYFWMRYDVELYSPFEFQVLNHSLFYGEKKCTWGSNSPRTEVLDYVCIRSETINSRDCAGDFYFTAAPDLWERVWLNFNEDLNARRFKGTGCQPFHGLASGRFLSLRIPIGFYKIRDVDTVLVRFSSKNEMYDNCTRSMRFLMVDEGSEGREVIQTAQSREICKISICHCNTQTMSNKLSYF